MNEIVIGNSGITVGSDNALVKVKAMPYTFRMTHDEARSMIDALCKVLNEPTREQCFEAGKQYWGHRIDTLTDYINEFKKEK